MTTHMQEVLDMTYRRLTQILVAEQPLRNKNDEETRELLLTLGRLAYEVGFNDGEQKRQGV